MDAAQSAETDRRDDWHALPPEAATEALASGPDGLSEAEAASRLAAHGPNSLPATKGRSAWRRLLAQFDNLLIYVLIAAAVVTALLGHAIDAAVILLVVFINTGVGFIQEGRAEKALDAIRDMLMPHASVTRDGRRVSVDAAAVVPGDLVLLEAGDRVPADIRLVRARNLRIEEAILTGESVPVEKSNAAVAADAALGDRVGMAYSGTLVTAGQGSGVAVATGTATELGRISRLLGSVEELTTPLLRQMNLFARRLTLVILVAAVAIFAFGVLVRDYELAEMFLAAVAVAVASIPEGLPAVMTITLAIGVQRMASRRAIIRRLPAVETLGAVSVICSDKTGTLTRNEMTVRSAVTGDGSFTVSGIGYEPRGAIAVDGREIDAAADGPLNELARAALLCNDAGLRHRDDGWAIDGDPMEGALVAFAGKAGHDIAETRTQWPRADEIPFDAEHRFMASLHHGHAGGDRFVVLKGAPERVIGMCDRVRGTGGDGPIDPEAWDRQVDALASEGQRVLALATLPAPNLHELTFGDVEEGLILLGLVGLIDPPRDEAITAVADCRVAGIRVKMITGDHAATAQAIARQLGLERTDTVATGRELEALDDEALKRRVAETDVFARTSPEHKLRLVAALQAEGAVVAMTGDGINDAPALKRADVGVAMGQKGTEAAKEAAGMVLTDDNFASIAAAVREGRTVYDNLKKTMAFLLPINGGEACAIVAAILLGTALPITPLQILWVNMVSSVALAMTLAFEPTEQDAMRRPPRPADEPLLSGFLVWRIVFVSGLFVAGIFGMFAWAKMRGLPLEEARTIAVNTLVAMEVFYLFSVRYLRVASMTLTGVRGTSPVLIGVTLVIVLQFAFTYAPFMQTLFDTRPLAFWDGAAIVAVGVVLLVVLEAEKSLRRRLTGAAGRRRA
ncbi:MAG: cation-transporting P-type ATPase [Alphaproteobacteria bacterium]